MPAPAQHQLAACRARDHPCPRLSCDCRARELCWYAKVLPLQQADCHAAALLGSALLQVYVSLLSCCAVKAAENSLLALQRVTQFVSVALPASQGFTCLMQISTRSEDFVVDTLALRAEVGALTATSTSCFTLRMQELQ